MVAEVRYIASRTIVDALLCILETRCVKRSRPISRTPMCFESFRARQLPCHARVRAIMKSVLA